MVVSGRKTIWIVAGVIAPAAAHLLSTAWMDNSEQISALGILIGCLVLWLSEALPMCISTLLMICMLPLVGLMSFSDAISSFGTNTALFIMASSGITVALSTSNIPKQITAAVLKRTEGHPKVFIVGLGFVVTMFSAFMSSLAACTLFAGIMDPVLKYNDLKPGKSSFGKAVMLVIPACAGIGGFITPAGTPANILVLQILQERGHEITFLQWSLIGVPIGLLAATIFLANVLVTLKMEKVVCSQADSEEALTGRDHLIMIIISGIIIGWFAGSFLPGLSTTFVAVIGLIIMFVPVFDILNFKSFGSSVNWDLVLTMGSVSIIMTAISNTGLIATIAEMAFAKIAGCPELLMLILISLSICVFRAFIPTTTAVIALFGPMLLSIADMSGISSVSLLLILSFWAATALLLVYTEPIYLITYRAGYYKEKDLLAVGIIPSCIMTVMVSLIFYILS